MGWGQGPDSSAPRGVGEGLRQKQIPPCVLKLSNQQPGSAGHGPSPEDPWRYWTEFFLPGCERHRACNRGSPMAEKPPPLLTPTLGDCSHQRAAGAIRGHATGGNE